MSAALSSHAPLQPPSPVASLASMASSGCTQSIGFGASASVSETTCTTLEPLETASRFAAPQRLINDRLSNALPDAADRLLRDIEGDEAPTPVRAIAWGFASAAHERDAIRREVDRVIEALRKPVHWMVSTRVPHPHLALERALHGLRFRHTGLIALENAANACIREAA